MKDIFDRFGSVIASNYIFGSFVCYVMLLGQSILYLDIYSLILGESLGSSGRGWHLHQSVLIATICCMVSIHLRFRHKKQ